jgi:hypothetical protein
MEENERTRVVRLARSLNAAGEYEIGGAQVNADKLRKVGDTD